MHVQMGLTQVETTATGNTIEENMGIQIVKLSDDANYYRAHATTARDPTNSGTVYALFDTIDVEDEEDDAFSGATNGEITIQAGYEGDYLFMFSGTGTRSSNSGTRSIPQITLHKDGVDMGLGGMAWYTRGAQTPDTYQEGTSGGIIVESSGTSTYAYYGRHLGQDPNEDRLDANEYGVMAVRLDDLFDSGTDTCTCAGLNQDWEINHVDACTISEACDLGIGTLSFIGSGTTQCDAQIKTTNLGDPGSGGILEILDNCAIYVS